MKRRLPIVALALVVSAFVLWLRVQTKPSQLVSTSTPAPGSYYVTLSQPLAALVSAALEPDSQNSFAANRLLEIGAGQLRRVMRPPPVGLTK